MPSMSGLDATRHPKHEHPEIHVLILTIHDREEYFFEGLQAGASGYMLKGADVQDLLTAVRSVSRGDVYLYPGLARQLLDDYLRRVESGEAKRTYDALTDRRQEVLRLIAQDKTTPEIAAVLHLGPHTVRSHREHIMDKLGLHSKAEPINYAIRKGLVVLDS